MTCRLLFVLASAALAAAGCSRSDAPAPPPPNTASAPSAASSPASPASAPAAEPPAAAAPDHSRPSEAAAPIECGKKPLPDCPLQAWMKTSVNPPTMNKDLPALAAALDKVAEIAPAGYPNWVSITKDGAAAARSGDLDAAKASCRGCHDQYKQKYKTEMRARKI